MLNCLGLEVHMLWHHRTSCCKAGERQAGHGLDLCLSLCVFRGSFL